MNRHRPGLVKASSLPADLSEDELGGAIVRSVLGDLDVLIAKRGRHAGSAFAWGTPERGGARLIQGGDTGDAESLRISWNRSKIRRIEIEPRSDASFRGPESPADPAKLMSWLVPRVWAHIRAGGVLPVGVDRFADFF